ncbi:MAG TPA: S9 family peptidase [Candidatus Acidoferrales bacterium]
MRACGLVLLALTCATGAAAQTGLKSDSLWKWTFVGETQISPDGAQIAYVVASVDERRDTYTSAIWVADVATGAVRPMTSSTARNFSPRWSPDGRSIAFLSNRNPPGQQVYVLSMGGGEARQITRVGNSAGNIEWSPDGKRIAFTSRVAPETKSEQLPPGVERAPKERVVTRLTYRMDGAGYLPDGFVHIFVTAADGSGEPGQITRGDFNHGAPAWSPDGQWIAFSAIRKPDADYALGDSEIFVISPEGGEPRQLTDRRGPDSNPTWSPDSKQIAYTGSDEKFASYTVTRLYVMAADGSARRELTPLRVWDRSIGDGVIGDTFVPVGGMGGSLDWTTDGQRVVFISADRGNANLYSVPAAGGDVAALTREDHDISGFSLASNGRIAAVRSTPTDPYDVYTFTLTNTALRRLTNVNAELLRGVHISPAEAFWYSSFDGKQMQGWILKPPGFQPGKKYPLILYIHGGPHAMYGNTFFHEFQMLAGRGYVVLYTNPRGSSGYGGDFGNIIQYKYPGEDYRDLMAGVDEVIRRGYVDDKRMGVAGGSGGGVLTAWTIGQTTRFAAAAPQRGVYNWASFVGTADFNLNFVRRWFRGFPWESPAEYFDRSPVNHVHKVTTPTLVVHSEEDWRVPIAQGEELFTRLKMLNKAPAEMVRFPQEPHGLSRMGRPSHRISRLEHIAGWMDKYCKP